MTPAEKPAIVLYVARASGETSIDLLRTLEIENLPLESPEIKRLTGDSRIINARKSLRIAFGSNAR